MTESHLVKEFTKDLLKVKIYDTEEEMGRASAECIARAILGLQNKEEINILVSTARSQEAMFQVLQKKELPWEKINVFHVDEYIGLPAGDEHRLSHQLLGYFFLDKKFKNTFFMDPLAQDTAAESQRYEALLRGHGIDISLLGIGDNGHLAFNEPDIADFNDPVWVKKVKIDDISKNQLWSHKNYGSLAEIPDNAYTVTVPALMSAAQVICTVPFKTKAEAAKNAVFGEISEMCPASIMRRHIDATLFLDTDSAGAFL